jgi:2-oxoglutarate dehydrogenase E2 component (dihydrolipoamide succinyltransferase)
MSESVNLPALGESVTEGTVTRWLKQVGDRVEVDEPLLEVSTDKVDTEIPSPIAGVIEEILVAEDETADVGAPLVRIGDGSGGGSADSNGSAAPAAEPAAEAAPEPAPEPAAEAAPEPAQEEAPAPAASGGSDGASESGSGEGTEVTLPALGESVTEGTITRWLKAVGDEVAVDEPLLEVSTDKVDTEIPSPVAGTLQEIRVNEDETAEVGSVLAVIGTGAGAPAKVEAPQGEPLAAGEAETREAPVAAPKAEEAPKPAEKTSEPEQEAAPAPQAAPAAPQEAPAAKADAPAESQPAGDAYVTPLVRRLANQNGVDLASVQGTGVGGRIRKQDVLEAAEAAKAAAAAPAPAAAPASAPARAAAPAVEPSKLRGTVEKAPRIRQTIAKRMRESLQVSAQLTQVIEVDMSRIARLRNTAKNSFQAQNGAKLTFLPFISKAVMKR